MAKKACISIDLSTLAGTLKFIPGPQLPRSDKKTLELMIAKTFLSHLSSHEGSKNDMFRSSDSDPPDILFRYNGDEKGLELAELAPVNRLEKDSIIKRLKRDIVSCLNLGNHTRGYVVNILLANDYADKLRPGRIHKELAEVLNELFAEHDRATEHVDVPKVLKHIVKHITVFKEDLTGDPRIENDNEPLIIFGAQSTLLIPEDDCPSIVEKRLSRKGLHDLDMPTWLVLWSNHHSLHSLRDGLDNAIGCYLKKHPMNYERIFHLHLFPSSGATEFPQK